MVTHALIYALIVAAEDDDVLTEREAVGRPLVEALAIGGGEDDLVVVALGGEVGDEPVDGFDLQHHTRSETEGIVIYFAVLVQGPVAQVMHVYLAQPTVLGTLNDGVVERRLQQFGTTCDDINSHIFKLSAVSHQLSAFFF